MDGLIPVGANSTALKFTHVENLAWSTAQEVPFGADMLIETNNTRDMPGFVLNRQDGEHRMGQKDDETHLMVQVDLYRCQISGGVLGSKIQRYLPTGRVGHIQVVGVPERHEASGGNGEVKSKGLARVSMLAVDNG